MQGERIIRLKYMDYADRWATGTNPTVDASRQRQILGDRQPLHPVLKMYMRENLKRRPLAFLRLASNRPRA